MDDKIQLNVGKAVQNLYKKNTLANKLFIWCATLSNDASETSVERIMTAVATDRRSAIRLAKELEEAGCGRFISGRRGASSRFEWRYSRVSLGKVAAGEVGSNEPVSGEPVADPDEQTQVHELPLTIALAKVRLAESLGVRPEQIEILVRV